MRKKLTELTAEERAAIFADRSLPPEWLVDAEPFPPEELAALRRIGIDPDRGRAERAARTELPPNPAWMRPDEIDWDSPVVRQVLDVMPDGMDLSGAVGLLLRPQPDLALEDGSACRPVDWLAQGRDLEAVLTLATSLGDPK